MATFADAATVAVARQLEDQLCGCRDFDIRDPDGHVIGVGQIKAG